MKNKFISTVVSILLVFFFFVLVLVGLTSCSNKTDEETNTTEVVETTEIETSEQETIETTEETTEEVIETTVVETTEEKPTEAKKPDVTKNPEHSFENTKPVEPTKSEEVTTSSSDETEPAQTETDAVQNIPTSVKTMEEFIEYKKLIESGVVQVTTIYDVYTADQINIIARCVETEVYQCSFNAKTNVADVIFNRVDDSRFPNDPVTVITSPKQFAYSRTKISESTILAIEYSFIFRNLDKNILYFHSNAKKDTFSGAKYVFTDDAGHHFYKK